ncbi:hypothetical protein AB0436_04910 [Streptomyces sp. NPDC051322]|uniref:hypothetical protein n=1 Tax=Streptomyces sp. NPDC051322 TaxID=3154645 RepID=UPI00344F8851
MSHKLPISAALQSLRDELGSNHHEFAESTAHDAWPAFLRFGRQRFDTPAAPDSDGLLIQYGTHAFGGPPMFTLDLCRQFEINDVEGEHYHYVQVHCELRYALQSSLQHLGTFDSWFFHDAGSDLDTWAAGLGIHLELLRGHRPAKIRLYEELL